MKETQSEDVHPHLIPLINNTILGTPVRRIAGYAPANTVKLDTSTGEN